MTELQKWQKDLREEQSVCDDMGNQVTRFTISSVDMNDAIALRTELKNKRINLRNNKNKYPELPVNPDTHQNVYEEKVDGLIDQMRKAEDEINKHIEDHCIVNRSGPLFYMASGNILLASYMATASILRKFLDTTPAQEISLISGFVGAWAVSCTLPSVVEMFKKNSKRMCFGGKKACFEERKEGGNLQKKEKRKIHIVPSYTKLYKQRPVQNISRRAFILLRFAV